MGSIRITEFGGIKPRDHRGFGPQTRASRAIDAKLWHGSLQPWRYPSLEIPSSEKICKMYMTDCCVVTSPNKCASFTELETNCGRVFSTEHMDWPAYATLPDCSNSDCGQIPELEWKRLGVPRPKHPVLLRDFEESDPHEFPLVDHSHNKKLEMRSYIYTFVNEYGEESEPSHTSDVISAGQDSCGELLFSIPPMTDDFSDPVSIRIYRGGSGFNEEGVWEKAISDFFFTEEIPFQTGNFIHTECVDPQDLGEANRSECNSVPLENLKNITMTDDGTLVASEGKNLWFSEPWKPHAWECHLNLDDCIEGITVTGPLIYVATNGHPYVISSKANEDECKCCREVTKLRVPAPISCKRSLVSTHNGAMYASDMGLVQFTGTSMQIDTHPYMAEDDWQEWMPHDLTGVFNKGRYYGFNAERGFIWDSNDGMYTDAYLGDSGKFSELSLTPTAVYSSEQNILYMAFEGGIYRWDASDTPMPYTWRSKLHIEGGIKNFSTMKIVFEKWLRTKKSPTPVTVRLYADNKLQFSRNVDCSRPFRLPKGYDALNWEIEVSGVESINEIHMATSMKELVLLNNA